MTWSWNLAYHSESLNGGTITNCVPGPGHVALTLHDRLAPVPSRRRDAATHGVASSKNLVDDDLVDVGCPADSWPPSWLGLVRVSVCRDHAGGQPPTIAHRHTVLQRPGPHLDIADVGRRHGSLLLPPLADPDLLRG